MKTARELTKEQLASIVERVQGLLYLDMDAEGREFWNADKSWTPDTLDDIARKLAEYELVPTEAIRAVPEELERLIARIEEAGDGAILDDLVIDLKCSEASAINNSGVQAQVEYVVSQLGTEETVRQVSELLEASEDQSGQ